MLLERYGNQALDSDNNDEEGVDFVDCESIILFLLGFSIMVIFKVNFYVKVLALICICFL